MNQTAAIIKSIRDIMRKDSGVDGDAQRISQMVWMLFLKVFSDKELEWKTNNKRYESPVPEKMRWENWATNDRLTDSELIDFINVKLFPTLKKLKSTSTDLSRIIQSVFEDTYNYMKNGSLFRQVVNEINKLNFGTNCESHVFNDIYESVLKELQSAGSSGEYYTPRAITQFMVDMIDIKIGETILDPACGTGGFLTCSIDKVLENDNSPKTKKRLQTMIRGVEKKPLPHLLCTTNLILHGIDIPNITRDNLLTKPHDAWTNKDQVDIVLSNPPFGGIEEAGIDSNFPVEFRTKETADLFIVLILKLLKNNGRAAVILPDGFLYGEGVRTRIKETLLSKCNLHTIVRLPNGVFSPYTNIKTNLLFFDKGVPTKTIWFFEHNLPNFQKNYSRSRPINTSEFQVEKQWWNNRIETEYAWKVSIEDVIKRNYNLDISSPYFGENEDRLNSGEILLQLEKTVGKIQVLLESLKNFD